MNEFLEMDVVGKLQDINNKEELDKIFGSGSVPSTRRSFNPR